MWSIEYLIPRLRTLTFDFVYKLSLLYIFREIILRLHALSCNEWCMMHLYLKICKSAVHYDKQYLKACICVCFLFVMTSWNIIALKNNSLFYSVYMFKCVTVGYKLEIRTKKSMSCECNMWMQRICNLYTHSNVLQSRFYRRQWL